VNGGSRKKDPNGSRENSHRKIEKARRTTNSNGPAPAWKKEKAFSKIDNGQPPPAKKPWKKKTRKKQP